MIFGDNKFKTRLPPFKKLAFIWLSESSIKMMKNAISSWKLFPFLRYLNFCPDFFGHVEKRLDKKVKVYFKIYDVINWETNNYNTYIAQKTTR